MRAAELPRRQVCPDAPKRLTSWSEVSLSRPFHKFFVLFAETHHVRSEEFHSFRGSVQASGWSVFCLLERSGTQTEGRPTGLWRSSRRKTGPRDKRST